LEALNANKFRLGSEAVALTIIPFGVPDESTNTIWTIRGGYEDTTERIVGALRNPFSTAKDAEPFYTKAVVKRVIQDDVPNGQFVVKFEKPTPWIGEHLQLKEDFRLITCEPGSVEDDSSVDTLRGGYGHPARQL
jgi:hypothetical protein